VEDKPLKRGAYNLDNLGADAFGGDGDALMTDVQAKPKRAPPARFGGKAAGPKPSTEV